jgi:hypothetical protein
MRIVFDYIDLGRPSLGWAPYFISLMGRKTVSCDCRRGGQSVTRIGERKITLRGLYKLQRIELKEDQMLSRGYRLLLVACLVTGTLWAANDPFVGKWKIDPSKSKLNDEMKVEAAGVNKYTLTFAPGIADTIVADGSDQPALRGTTLSITVQGPNHWEVIRKLKGRTLLTGYWTLSAEGKTLNDAYTEYAPDGSTSSIPYVYQRTAGNSGFPGTWDSEKVKAEIELQIQPYEVTAFY